MLAHYDQAAIKAQRVVRGWLARKQVAVLKEKRRQIAAVRIQAGMTSYVTIMPCLSIYYQKPCSENQSLWITTVPQFYCCISKA